MPGTYTHHPTVQGMRGGEFVYNTTSVNLVVVDSAVDFTIDMDDYYFMVGETKEVEVRVKNDGSVAADGITLTLQINNRFTYVSGSIVAGDGSISPTVERFEGGGLFVQFPDTLEVGAGQTLPIRFQVTAN